jgi:hypothetical protein
MDKKTIYTCQQNNTNKIYNFNKANWELSTRRNESRYALCYAIHMLCCSSFLNDTKLVNKENKAITLYKKGNYELFSKYNILMESNGELNFQTNR